MKEYIIDNSNTYNITSALLPAMVNNDYTGLDDEECTELDEWLENEYPNGFIIDDIADESEFTFCDILQIMADCYKVTITPCKITA